MLAYESQTQELELSQAEVNVSGRKISDADANGRVAEASSGFHISVQRKKNDVCRLHSCDEVEVKLQAEGEGSQFGI